MWDVWCEMCSWIGIVLNGMCVGNVGGEIIQIVSTKPYTLVWSITYKLEICKWHISKSMLAEK